MKFDVLYNWLLKGRYVLIKALFAHLKTIDAQSSTHICVVTFDWLLYIYYIKKVALKR